MERITRSRPSPALIVGVVALIAALAGTAVAGPEATTSAVTKAKVKKIAKKQARKLLPITTEELGDNAATTPKIADNAVTTPKIANDAVTAPKLAPSERSEAFIAATQGTSPEFGGSFATPPVTIQTLSLPEGQYVVTGKTAVVNGNVAPPDEVFSECILNDDGTEIDRSADTARPGLFFPSGGIDTTGIADGGEITLGCHASDTGQFGFRTKIVAIRVGAVS
jgi:hypothetical protein